MFKGPHEDKNKTKQLQDQGKKINLWTCTPLIRLCWLKVILTGYTLKFLGGAVVSEPVEPTLAQGLQKSVLRLFRSCTLPKCFSTTSKYHGQPTTTIMSDWNNVYGIGESYHYDFIQLITVESLVVVKMASNCQIVPLAPEKNSSREVTFPCSQSTIHYCTSI